MLRKFTLSVSYLTGTLVPGMFHRIRSPWRSTSPIRFEVIQNFCSTQCYTANFSFQFDRILCVLWDKVALMLLMACFSVAVGVAIFIKGRINFLRMHHISNLIYLKVMNCREEQIRFFELWLWFEHHNLYKALLNKHFIKPNQTEVAY